jgi:hypothetical protein
VFENRILRKAFGPIRKEVTEEWRKMHKKERRGLYSSHEFRVIRSKRMRRVGHIERIVEKRNACRVVMGKPEGDRPLKNVGVQRRIILKWILKEYNGEWTRFVWLRIWRSEELLSTR